MNIWVAIILRAGTPLIFAHAAPHARVPTAFQRPVQARLDRRAPRVPNEPFRQLVALPDPIREDYLSSYDGDRFVESMRYVRAYPAELPVLRDLLPGIQTPVQIIAGAREQAVPPVNAEFLHDRLPEAGGSSKPNRVPRVRARPRRRPGLAGIQPRPDPRRLVTAARESAFTTGSEAGGDRPFRHREAWHV